MDNATRVEDSVAWRTVVDQLATGKVVTLPCQFEREFVRRTAQAAKRAARADLTVEIIREDRGLRLVPQPSDSSGNREPDRAEAAAVELAAGRSSRREKRRRASRE